MTDPEINNDSSVEDAGGVTAMLRCAPNGHMVFPNDKSLTLKAPPDSSQVANRLILASSDKGSIVVKTSFKLHKVQLLVVEGTDNRSLLIRIPIGVDVFKITQDSGFFLYYTTTSDYNVIPIHLPMGSDPSQKMQELILAVSPVPPRDPSLATNQISFKTLTLEQLNVRRQQEGLPLIK